jgi:DNA-binding GntR family transcriptional regulator
MAAQPDTLSRQVYEQIRRKILEREFVPGTKFTYRQLAEQFGVSRIPIGEAVRRLEQDGLVVCTARGVYINHLTIRDVEEIFDIREVLEGLSCRLFTGVATPADMELLEAYSNDWDRHLAKGDFDSAQEANVKFHLHIAKRCSYPYLAQLVETLLLRVRTISLTTFGGKKEKWQMERWGHRRILTAIARKDPKEAEEAMREHIRFGKEDIIAAIIREGRG